MQYHIQPNDNCCTLTCFAMLLDVLPHELIIHIGANGSELISEGIHRGHHIVELIDISIRQYNTHPFIIDRYPIHIHEEEVVEFDEIDIDWYLRKYDGIILFDEHCGVYQTSEPSVIYNPIGKKVKLSKINVSGFIGFPR